MQGSLTRTLVLHIGLPKAGSSAVQHGLAINRLELSKRGLHYAPLGLDPLTAPAGISSGNGGDLALLLDPTQRPPGYNPSHFNLLDYVSLSHPISLISSEGLAAAKFGPLVDFRDNTARAFTIKVIAFIRDLAEHARSSWVQAIKRHAYAGDLYQYCLHEYNNPQYKRVRLYRKVFGAESVVAPHYNSLQEDLTHALLRAIGISREDLRTSLRVNRGLTAQEITIMRGMNACHRSPATSKVLSNWMLTRHPSREAWHQPSPDVLELLAANHSEELRWANDRLFQKKNLWRI